MKRLLDQDELPPSKVARIYSQAEESLYFCFLQTNLFDFLGIQELQTLALVSRRCPEMVRPTLENRSYCKQIPGLSIDWEPLHLQVGLEKLEIRGNFNGVIVNLHSSKLTHLNVGPWFRRDVEFPSSLTHLVLGDGFERRIDNLPSLTHLAITLHSGQHIKLPETLTHLRIDGCNYESLLKLDRFQHAMQNLLASLPLSLVYLSLRKNFNQNIDNLPLSLRHLILGDCFNEPVDNLPLNLTRLSIGANFNQSVDHLPVGLTHLRIGANFDSVDCLPVDHQANFNQPVNCLPESLTHLFLHSDFNQPVNKLPKSLVHLSLGYDFNREVDHLPPGLKSLTFIAHSPATTK